MLATVLSILLTSCQTKVKSELYVPTLDVEVNRPTLEPIPDIDLSGYTQEQLSDLSSVFSAYNNNLLVLVDYSDRLLEMQEVIIEYYTEIIQAVK